MTRSNTALIAAATLSAATYACSALGLSAAETAAAPQTTAVAAQTEISVAQCAQRFPLIVQNMCEIETISFASTEGISEDQGITWRLVDKQTRFTADIKNKIFKTTEISYPFAPRQERKYMEYANIDGQHIRYYGDSAEDEKDVFHPKNVKKFHGTIQHGGRNIFEDSSFFYFFLFNDGKTRINEVFSNPQLSSRVKIREHKSEGIVSIYTEGGVRFDFDTATGRLSKRVVEIYSELKKGPSDYFIVQADGYFERNGQFFPKVLIKRYAHPPLDKRMSYGKRVSRITIHPDSFEVNKKYVPADFSIVFPAGTPVYHEQKGLFGKIEQSMSSIDIPSIVSHLTEITARRQKEKK
ncbi:MAG: PE family protein [Puniceicoccales bacterium]|jgi:hypothetical protein|nr:PE family protein [Puniceicoccales bacterium]